MKKIVILLSLLLLCGSLCACADGKAESSGFPPESVMSANSALAGADLTSSAPVSVGVDVNAVFPPEVWKTVDDWSPEPDEFWNRFFALPEQGTDAPGSESQASVLEWLVWFSGKSEEEQKLICYRPEYFGIYPKSVREELAASREERIDTRVLRMVEEELKYDVMPPDDFWLQFYSLPVRDSKWNQESVLQRFEYIAAATGTTSGVNDAVYSISASLDPTPETKAHSAQMDPAILKVVEDYVYSPDNWWALWFADLIAGKPLSEEGLETRRKNTDWLEWFAALPEEEMKFVNYHPFCFNCTDGELMGS